MNLDLQGTANTIKGGLFVVGVFVAYSATLFFSGFYSGCQHERATPKPLPYIVRDTITIVGTTPQPARSTTIMNRGMNDSKQQARLDSALTEGISRGLEAKKKQFEFVATQWDTTIRFDSVGSVTVHYDPLTHVGNIGLLPAPLKITTRTVIDSVFVPQPQSGESWWAHPLLVVSGAAAAILVRAFAVK